MHVQILVLCMLLSMTQSENIRAIVHTFASIKRVNAIFVSTKTVEWIRSRIVFKNTTLITEMIPKYRNKIFALNSEIMSDARNAEISHYTLLYKNMLRDTALITIHDMCLYIKFITYGNEPEYISTTDIGLGYAPNQPHPVIFNSLAKLLSTLAPFRHVMRAIDTGRIKLVSSLPKIFAAKDRVTFYLVSENTYVRCGSMCHRISGNGTTSLASCPENADAYLITHNMAPLHIMGLQKQDQHIDTPISEETISKDTTLDHIASIVEAATSDKSAAISLTTAMAWLAVIIISILQN